MASALPNNTMEQVQRQATWTQWTHKLLVDCPALLPTFCGTWPPSVFHWVKANIKCEKACRARVYGVYTCPLCLLTNIFIDNIIFVQSYIMIHDIMYPAKRKGQNKHGHTRNQQRPIDCDWIQRWKVNTVFFIRQNLRLSSIPIL